MGQLSSSAKHAQRCQRAKCVDADTAQLVAAIDPCDLTLAYRLVDRIYVG